MAEQDRTVAQEWLAAYGLEMAKWMVQCCVKMQKERHALDVLLFRGLQLYESAAAGAYEQLVAEEAIRKERQFSEELDRCWSTYRRELVKLFDARTSAEGLAALEAEVRESFRHEKPDTPDFIRDALLSSRLFDLKATRMSALSEGEFRAHRNLRALRDALIERHAVDLLAPSSGDSEREGALSGA